MEWTQFWTNVNHYFSYFYDILVNAPPSSILSSAALAMDLRLFPGPRDGDSNKTSIFESNICFAHGNHCQNTHSSLSDRHSKSIKFLLQKALKILLWARFVVGAKGITDEEILIDNLIDVDVQYCMSLRMKTSKNQHDNHPLIFATTIKNDSPKDTCHQHNPFRGEVWWFEPLLAMVTVGWQWYWWDGYFCILLEQRKAMTWFLQLFWGGSDLWWQRWKLWTRSKKLSIEIQVIDERTCFKIIKILTTAFTSLKII